MSVVSLPVTSLPQPRREPSEAVVFHIFNPPVLEADLNRETGTRRAIAAMTPPNAVLRDMAARSRPPAELLDADKDETRPW